MNQHEPIVATRLEIGGLEVLENAISSGTVYPTQMGVRKPSGQIVAAMLGDSMLTYGDMNADYSVTGMFSDQMLSFGIFIEVDHSMMLSHDARPGDFCILPASTNHFAQHYGNLKYAVWTADLTRLYQLADAEGIDVDPRMFEQWGLYRPGAEWAAYALDICNAMSDMQAPLVGATENASMTRAQMGDDLIRLVLHSMVQIDLARLEASPFLQASERLVRDAHNLNWNYTGRPLTVDGLADTVGVSRRTLYRAFKSQLGISPAKYLKYFRMSRVHLELSHTERRQTTVGCIALSWGFGDLGRFSGDYYRMFKEYPSQTLARPVVA